MQEYLIAVIDDGPAHKKVGAPCGPGTGVPGHPRLPHGRGPAGATPYPGSRAADDEVADLRGRCRAACLTAFVDCDHQPTREWLARGFHLDEDGYPPALREVVARARAIAAADLHRYRDLLTRRDDGTTLAQLGPGYT